MRTKFICVSPITPKARIFFELDMLELHSCRVEREDLTHTIWNRSLNVDSLYPNIMTLIGGLNNDDN